MRLVVVGGQSRNVGKTSLAAAIIAANPELHWTAFKITQYGYGVCSTNGQECGCTVEDPDCPFSAQPEFDAGGNTDTSRFLRAGAKEVYWVRTRTGQLHTAMPELRRLLRGREFVIMESNSILEFLRPDLYLSVLDPGVADFKASGKLYLSQADAYVVTGAAVHRHPSNERPIFTVSPASYFSPEINAFVQRRLDVTTPVE